MKIVCISDTHGIHHRMPEPIPDGDILLHAGDITRHGRLEDLDEVEEFFAFLTHSHKFFTPGNHDWIFERAPEKAQALVSSAECLIDRIVEVEGLKIWGSPWQPEFHNWAFNLPRGKALAEVWSQIPDDTDIILTHGPPRGVGDLCSNGIAEGCDDLLARIEEIQPILHVSGHIHEGYGVKKVGKTTFINASVCNLAYRPVNAPIVFEI